jgi:hypothetical protein
MLFGGVASADRWRGHRDSSRHSGGTVVRDHRGGDRYREPVRTERRSYRDGGYRQRVDRRPVYVNNGRYTFHGGVTRVYNRPVIRHRYYDYRYRPQIIIENYDPVPGYIWVQGNWNWNGYEWVWTSGYWAVDTSYQDDYYYSQPGVSGGVTIQGGVSF